MLPPLLDLAEKMQDNIDVIADTPTSVAEAQTYLQRLLTMLQDFAVTYGGRLVAALVILFIGFKVVNTVSKKLNGAKGIKKLDPATKKFINNVLAVVFKLIIGITALAVLGVPMTSIVAVIGSCGLAIGLALQGSLSNIAGGFVLMVVKPFKVGDFIVSGEVSGTVTEIGVFNTSVTTIDNKVIVIPNASISNATLTNVSALPERRVDLTFTAAYSDDVDLVERTLLSVCENHEKILRDPAPFARLSAHRDSALEYTVRAWVKTPDYWEVYFDLQEQVKKAFDKNGVTIPFPQVEISRHDSPDKEKIEKE